MQTVTFYKYTNTKGKVNYGNYSLYSRNYFIYVGERGGDKRIYKTLERMDAEMLKRGYERIDKK